MSCSSCGSCSSIELNMNSALINSVSKTSYAIQHNQPPLTPKEMASDDAVVVDLSKEALLKLSLGG